MGGGATTEIVAEFVGERLGVYLADVVCALAAVESYEDCGLA